MGDLVQKRIRELETLNDVVKTFQKDAKVCVVLYSLSLSFTKKLQKGTKTRSNTRSSSIVSNDRSASVARSQTSHRKSNVSMSSTEA